MDLQENHDYISKSHLAGIVPILGTRRYFSFSWPDCFMPVSKDTTAVEKAVMACAYAGCRTIWVICDRAIQKYLKRRLGEYVIDPTNYHIENIKKQAITKIPIFYVAVDQRYLHYYNEAFFILYGINAVEKTAGKISRWTVPSHYFISFPMGVIDNDEVQSYRRKYANIYKMVMLTKDGKGVNEGVMAPFTIDYDQWHLCHKYFTSVAYSKRKKCSLKEVFSNLNMEQYNTYEVEQYHQIAYWDSYVKYLSSPIPKNIWRNRILTDKRWYKLRYSRYKQKTTFESFDNASETPCDPPAEGYSESTEGETE